MEKRIAGCGIDIVDALKYINPQLKIDYGTYLPGVRSIPGVYGKHDLSEKMNPSRAWLGDLWSIGTQAV